MRRAAFFDLDLTLLRVNSGHLWVKRDLRLGRITRWQYLQGLFYFLAYRLDVLPVESALRKGLGTIKGMREDTVREWTREWYYEEVAAQVTPGGLRALAEHRAAGHPLILLTSSSPYEAAVAAEHLGLDAWLSSTYEVVDGVFTGDFVRPLCYNSGKVVWARKFAEQHDIDIDRSYFYSDSASDLPMLRAVGNPRVVNPDWRLAIEARKQGWTVLDWNG